jgi:drug/metabolite transporter (DMT)-like permease
MFMFERKAGVISLHYAEKPLALRLYGLKDVYPIALSSEEAAALSAACPVRLVLEREDRWRGLNAVLGALLVMTGWFFLASFTTTAMNMAGAAGREMPPAFLMGLLALAGGACLAWWGLGTHRMFPEPRKQLGTYVLLVGILGLAASLFVLYPILPWDPSPPLPRLGQFLGAAACLAVAALFLLWGISARRRAKRERVERRKSQAAQQIVPGSPL